MGYQHYFTCIYEKKNLAPAHVFMRVGWGHQWGHVDTCVAALMFICFQWTSSSFRTTLDHIHPWNTFTKAIILTVFFTFGKGLTPVLSGSWFQNELLVPVFIYLLLLWFVFVWNLWSNLETISLDFKGFSPFHEKIRTNPT
jgi:hypothetical protein